MRINKLYLEAALKKLSDIRYRNKQLEEQRHSEIINKIPEYEILEKTLAQTMTDIVNSMLDKTPTANDMINAATEKNQETQKRINELLVTNGYPIDYLDPIFSCRKCKDTGNTGNEWCECLCRITNEMAAAELNEKAPLKKSRFDNFDLSLYNNKANGDDNISPQAIMRDNLEYCKKFANNFNGKGKGILMIGNTGLGKTHLSLSIANELIEKGFCVVYGSVPELIRMIQNEQYNKSEGDTLSLVTNSDLLIMDDLGAENRTDWCLSMLYEIINTRQNRQLPIIINTNLDIDEIKEKYQDRLSSRMFCMKILFFTGSDNRVELSENFGNM